MFDSQKVTEVYLLHRTLPHTFQSCSHSALGILQLVFSYLLGNLGGTASPPWSSRLHTYMKEAALTQLCRATPQNPRGSSAVLHRIL